ncbi:MAG: VOC family protein [Phycisphaeraceae bacterium]|nr:VOC family protein [Phycisphaeraceae bacterium]
MSNIGPGVRPHLMVKGGDAAIDFYVKAFSAKEIHERVRAGDNDPRLLHGEVEIAGTVVYLADDFPEHCGGKSSHPKALGGTPVVLHQCVPDCDAAFNRAVDAGATPRMPPADMIWGDRYAQIEDPFGHVWSFSTPTKK